MPPAKHFIRLYVAIFGLSLALIVINALMGLGFRWPFEVLDRQFDLTDETNLAAWYSSAQLLTAGLVALLIGWVVPGPAGLQRIHRLIWAAAALLLIGLSADEVSQLHEWAGQRYEAYFGQNDRLGDALGIHDVYLWLLLFAPLMIVALWCLLYLCSRCLSANRSSMYLALGGIACWVVTIGAEYVEGRFLSYRFNSARGAEAIIEEGCEVLGAALLLVAFLEYFRTQAVAGPLSTAAAGTPGAAA